MSEAGATSELTTLIELQEEDLRADQLRYQIDHHPLRIAQRELEAKRTTVAERARSIDADREVLASRQSALEEEIGHLDSRVSTIEQRLRSPAAGSFRDQEAMATEIGSLAARKRELEDEELEIMEALEPLDAEIAALASEDAALLEQHETHGRELATAVGEIEEQLAQLGAARAPLVALISQPLLEEYERLRSRLGGIGVARVIRGACSGCNLALPSTELDRIRHAAPGSITHCEQCGRLLLP